ncbi:MAG: NAD-dependent epimerase/dehydratase family protein [Vicinamibacterales bacterium]
MHLVVTGAAGFIGRAVVEAALARGHQVTGVVRTPNGTLPAGVREAVADLARPGPVAPHLAGADAVIHCAASLGGGEAEQQRDTVLATAELVRAMTDAGVGRIVLSSSMAVYDFARIEVGALLDESSPLDDAGRSRGPYIAAKRAQEAAVSDPAAGLDWRILRPGLVFGPGRTWFHDLGLALHPRLWVSLAGAARLPLTYVHNCASAFVAAAESDAGPTTALIVDDDLPTRRDYLSALARHARPTPVVLDVSWAVASGGSRIAGLVGVTPGVLHPERLAARCKPLRYSNAAAKAAWGWWPGVGMGDALRQSIG